MLSVAPKYAVPWQRPASRAQKKMAGDTQRCSGHLSFSFVWDQAKRTAVERRRIAAPIRPKPPIIIAQLAGSGTGEAVKVTVPV
jgi:hypothetical protein